jgi:hypothetical protein
MSIGQVLSHALPTNTSPEPFLLQWHPFDMLRNKNDGGNEYSQKHQQYVSTMKFLYGRTPSVVLQMAYSVLVLGLLEPQIWMSSHWHICIGRDGSGKLVESYFTHFRTCSSAVWIGAGISCIRIPVLLGFESI